MMNAWFRLFKLDYVTVDLGFLDIQLSAGGLIFGVAVVPVDWNIGRRVIIVRCGSELRIIVLTMAITIVVRLCVTILGVSSFSIAVSV